ncbi:hypothetical protein [Actinomycetospora aeridis]|uniref:Uncharacterized protein n=1 Tax=Actinomycetospora aeridis TaxID=3129231 RepID=A0ABU8NDD3_9PSEU
MAKDKTREDPVETALTAPETPIGAEPVPAGITAGPAAQRPALPAGPTSTPASTHGITDSVVSVAAEGARVVQRVLPHRTPIYLGGAALLVLGLVDLPAAAGGALVYEAIRRWHPAR